jgi:hypothetical protein
MIFTKLLRITTPKDNVHDGVASAYMQVHANLLKHVYETNNLDLITTNHEGFTPEIRLLPRHLVQFVSYRDI